jgi:hypothetical protein
MLTKKAGDRYPASRSPRRLSDQTVKHCLNLLRVCFASALDDELVTENVARDVNRGIVFSRSNESGPLWTINVGAIRDDP